MTFGIEWNPKPLALYFAREMLGAKRGFGMRLCTGYALGILATNKPMQQSFKMHVEENSRHLKRLARSLFKRRVPKR